MHKKLTEKNQVLNKEKKYW